MRFKGFWYSSYLIRSMPDMAKSEVNGGAVLTTWEKSRRYPTLTRVRLTVPLGSDRMDMHEFGILRQLYLYSETGRDDHGKDI